MKKVLYSYVSNMGIILVKLLKVTLKNVKRLRQIIILLQILMPYFP